jgi:hypothetical protein
LTAISTATEATIQSKLAFAQVNFSLSFSLLSLPRAYLSQGYFNVTTGHIYIYVNKEWKPVGPPSAHERGGKMYVHGFMPSIAPGK